ncbi:MAG: hypothetical protein OXF57_00115, partial [Rhodospirillaceae bacterium]|nr:hypothetical protein [Rhodospirillaceae bacterium]
AGLPVREPCTAAGPEADADRALDGAIEDRRALGRALAAAPRPTVLQAVADAAPEGAQQGWTGAVADDPPEERYARGGLPVPRTGPDLQPGDDREIDASESLWMQAMRAGDRPDDPWSEAVLAADEEIKARFAETPPAESPAGPADEPGDGPEDEPGDGPAGGDPAPEESAQNPAEGAMPEPADDPTHEIPAAPEDARFAAAQAGIGTADIGIMGRPPMCDAGLLPAGPAGEPATPAGP